MKRTLFAALWTVTAWAASVPGQSLPEPTSIDSATWTNAPVPAGTDPALTGRLVVQAASVRWDRGTRTHLTAFVSAHDPVSGALWVGHPAQGFCAAEGTLYGVAVEGWDLKVRPSRRLVKGDYAREREAELQEWFTAPSLETARRAQLISLRETFADQDERTVRGHDTRVTRARATAEGIDLELAGLFPSQARLRLDRALTPAQAWVGEREIWILAPGVIEGGVRRPYVLDDRVRLHFLSISHRPLLGPETTDELVVKNLDAPIAKPPGLIRASLGIDPKSGAIMALWGEPGRQSWWSYDCYRLGNQVVAVGWDPARTNALILPAVDRLALAGRKVDLTAMERRLAGWIETNRHPPFYRIDMARLVGRQRIGPAHLEPAKPRWIACTREGHLRLSFRVHHLSSHLREPYIDATVEVELAEPNRIAAATYRDWPLRAATTSPAVPLSIPDGVITAAD